MGSVSGYLDRPPKQPRKLGAPPRRLHKCKDQHQGSEARLQQKILMIPRKDAIGDRLVTRRALLLHFRSAARRVISSRWSEKSTQDRLARPGNACAAPRAEWQCPRSCMAAWIWAERGILLAQPGNPCTGSITCRSRHFAARFG